MRPHVLFRQFLGGEITNRIAITKPALERAKLFDEPVTDLQIEYRRLLELAASIQYPADEIDDEAARAALLAQWPEDFPPLPQWFADPASFAAANPPGPPWVVACGETPEEERARLAESAPKHGPRDMQEADYA